MEFVDLHSIIKDKYAITSVPNYLNKTETHTIYYKYNNPIRSTIFSFNKSDIHIYIYIDSISPDF